MKHSLARGLPSTASCQSPGSSCPARFGLARRAWPHGITPGSALSALRPKSRAYRRATPFTATPRAIRFHNSGVTPRKASSYV